MPIAKTISPQMFLVVRYSNLPVVRG